MRTEDSGLVKLISKEGKIHELPMAVAKLSNLIEESIGSDENDDEVDVVCELPVPKVRDKVLKKVIEFCKHYKEEEEMTTIQVPLKSSKVEDVVQPWYAEYVKVEDKLLFELIAAAHYMDIEPLLEVTFFHFLNQSSKIMTTPLEVQ